jgi:hypothetical protein
MITRSTIVRGMRVAGLAALAGGAAAIWAYLNEPQVFFTAWLAGFYFWLAMPLGALALLLIWDVTGGAWEPIARRPLTAMAATMPLFILLFLPVIGGMPALYSWSRPEAASLLHNRWYLNPEFFFIRAAAYFAVWNGFVLWRLLRPLSAAGVPPAGLQWVSAIGLMLMGYSVSFAGIDWIMSTEPDWFSSIYGMVVGSSQFIASLSFALLLIVLEAPTGAAQDAFGKALSALATILLAVVIFWAYTSFCQWLIIWEENLRKEIGWYLERGRGAWVSVVYTLAAAHFALPFAALVWTPAKRSRRLVGAVCLMLLVANLIHVWWLLLPPFRAIGFSWVHPVIAIGIGGVWLVCLGIALTFLDRVPSAQRHAERRLLHG